MFLLYSIITLITIFILILIIKRINHKKKKIILQIGPSLKDNGGMVTVMKQIADSKIANKYKIIHIPTYIYGKKYLFLFSAICKIVFAKLKYRVDLAHVHMASYGSFYRKSLLINLCKILKIKIVVHVHGACFNKFYEGLGNKKKKYISKILNKSEKLIVLSESWKQFFENIVPKEKIQILYNSVPLPEKKEQIMVNKTVFTALFLGRIGERKGVYDILEIAKKLEKVNIIIAGDGEKKKVKDIVEKNSLKNVTILDWLNEQEKEKYLKNADMYLLPSYDEGLPMSVLEAMSYSLPVITTNVGGIPELIQNGENGILITPGDKKALEKSIIKLCEDCEYRRSLGQNAYNTINERFNIEKYLEKLNDIYLQIKYKNIKVCLTSSAGGHFMQLKQLFKITKKYDTFIVTEKNEIAKDYQKNYDIKFLTQQERKNWSFIFEFLFNLVKAFGIAIIKNPDIVISTGAGATVFVQAFIKLFGGKVIFIESFAKINSPTVTGKIMYKIADEFYVQWEEMKKFYPNAHYDGGIY